MNNYPNDFFGEAPNSPFHGTEDNAFEMLRGTLAAVDNVSNEDFYVIDYKQRAICYMSPNLLDFLAAHDLQSKVDNTPLDLLMRSIPDPDACRYRGVASLFRTLYDDLPSRERSSLRVSGNYRLFNGREQVMVFGRVTPLQEDAERHLRFALCSVTNSSSDEAIDVLITKGYGREKAVYSLREKEWYTLGKIGLSDREHEVLNMAAQGLSTEAIASHIRRGNDAVKKIKKTIFDKLRSNNITQTVTRANNLGLM